MHINAKLVTFMSISCGSLVNLGLSNMNCIDINSTTGNTNITANINMALLEINLSCRKFANMLNNFTGADLEREDYT